VDLEALLASFNFHVTFQIALGIVYTLIGFILHVYLLSQAYIYLKSYSTYDRFQELRYQLQQYFAFKHLSNPIQRRILTFYDFCFRRKFFRRREIHESLGNKFRHLVSMDLCEHLLKENYFFRILPADKIQDIAGHMSDGIYLENDVVCKGDLQGQVCVLLKFMLLRNLCNFCVLQKLFLILSGTVAVYTNDGEEVAHLSDGSMFGESAFLHYDEDIVMEIEIFLLQLSQQSLSLSLPTCSHA